MILAYSNATEHKNYLFPNAENIIFSRTDSELYVVQGGKHVLIDRLICRSEALKVMQVIFGGIENNIPVVRIHVKDGKVALPQVITPPDELQDINRY